MSDPAEAPRPALPKTRRRGLRLSTKLVLPLIFILLLLAAASIFGSMQLIRESATDSEHRRLNAAKEVVFRQFKQQENLLRSYSTLFEDFHRLSRQAGGQAHARLLKERLAAALEKEGIRADYYTAEREEQLPPALRDLLQQTRRSKEPRFRYTSNPGGAPALTSATPLFVDGQIETVLVLSSTFGSDFLDRIATPLNIGASLHDLSGKMLTSSTSEVSPMELSIEQLKALAARGSLFADHDSPQGRVSHLFALLPVGTSDLLMLSVESSGDAIANLEANMLLRLSLTIGVALILGIIVYFRAIAIITHPARELAYAAKAISRGNFSYRIEEIPGDELGEVAVTFNQMAEQIDAIYRDKSDRDTESALALHEAKARVMLDHKNREIERVNEELRTHLREVSALYQLNQAMVSHADMKALFERATQTIIETMACDHVVVLLFNTRENCLEVASFAGFSANSIESVRFRLDQGVTGEAASTLKQIYIKDVNKDQRYLSYHDQVAVRGAFVATPLVVKGRLIGVLNLHKREVNSFVASELQMVQAIANQLAIATENTRLLEKARDSANIDDVTGLANRRYFQEILKREVAQARRFNSCFSVVMCTIDDYELYCEQHGRTQGDVLLHQVGGLLLNNTRGIDLVCRFGSQDFAILLPKTRKDGAVAAAEKLRQHVAEPVDATPAADTDRLRITLSFGVAEFPTDSKNIFELINQADRALLQARRDGSNRTVVWEEFMAAPADS